MALTVTFAHEKGGVGKTTCACEFAVTALNEGYKVILVDVDHQQTSTTFKMRRDEISPGLKPLRVVPVVGKTVGTQIKDFAQDADIVVVDAGGRDSQEMRLAMLVSNLVIIPTSIDDKDTDQLNKMAKLVNSVRVQNPDLKAWMLLWGVAPTNFTTTYSELQEELDKPIDPTVPGELISGVIDHTMRAHSAYRKAYGHAYSWGRSVREMDKRDPKASSEVQALFQEIIDNV